MSLQIISDKKVRKVSALTGVEFVAMRSWSNHHWVGVTAQHVHYTIRRPDTDTFIAELEDPPVCWSSCRERFDFSPFLPREHTLPSVT
jgi:hypothetical protein